MVTQSYIIFKWYLRRCCRKTKYTDKILLIDGFIVKVSAEV